jgi:uncharacterized protein YndB with AHSA1/START domain
MSDSYRLGYRWVVDGPIETVFHYVSDPRTFTRWFPVFKKVVPEEATGPIRVGSRSKMQVRALLPYTLDWDITVVRYEPPDLVEVDCRVVLGERFGMRGRIRYRFVQEGERTIVFNEQEMIADRPLPGWLHPIAQALFSFNHDWAMARGLPGLRRIVAARRPRAGMVAVAEAAGSR